MNTSFILHVIVILNGIYDILCATSILKIINLPPLNRLHLSMFHTKPNKSFLACYLFINGCIRIIGGINLNQYSIVALSYFIEAGYILYETIENNTIQYKAYFVIITSLLLGGLILIVD